MHDPRVPETLEGWSVLHQMFRMRWPAWRDASERDREALAAEALASLRGFPMGDTGCTAAVALLGHKADLMLVHFRRGFEPLLAAQAEVLRWGLAAFWEPAASYVSIVELGLYEMTAQIHSRLAEQGLGPSTPEFDAAFDREMKEQRRRVEGRLYPPLPLRRHVCFYPMNKRRGEQRNWYATPVDERARMMRDHGLIGRQYAGAVTQIISGSIGFDDWEWGVDLFADDPVVFKKLIYQMRFDEASVWYAEFGPFFVGLQFSPEELPRWLDGRVPELRPRES